jgi:nucleotide-binding universal stress UspA family protein
MGLLPAKVLVAVDAATASEHALDTARELCVRIGAELHLVHVKVVSSSMRSPRSAVRTPAQRAAAEGEAHAVLSRMRKRVEEHGGTVADVHVKFSKGIERGLAEAQEALDADLLVVPGRRTGPLAKRLSAGGSPVVPTGLIRRARRSVLVVQPVDHQPT